MKRCPTCDKTFDDNMRFCQTDGTPLVEDSPVDPYKTMVARPEDIAAAGGSGGVSGDVLDLPSDSDPGKTINASEDEVRAQMGSRDAADEQVIDIPPLVEPEQPKFTEPSPPPSPFSAQEKGASSTPPIPSPFDAPKPMTYETPGQQFSEPEPTRGEPSINPFDRPSEPLAQTDWTPPPAPDAGWQNQEIGQNTPFQPPPPGTGGVNQTLPIISLVLGIVSLCCYISPITGIAAVITGFIGLKNAKNDPQNYGGKGLAIAGMITGALFALLAIAYWVFILFFGGMAMLMDAAR